MDLSFSPDGDAFREEVRAFIRDHYPLEMRVPNPSTDLTKQQMLLWHRILHKMPTKRRACTRGPDRRPILEMLMVSIDISDTSFT